MGCVRRIVSNRTMLVGDAACQVKSVSGGGLHPGLTAAALLAETASKVLDDDLSERKLGAYAMDCGNAFSSELDKGWWLRCMFVRMTDDDLNAAGRFVSREDVRGVLDGIDIDHPSLVVGRLLGHPIAFLSAMPLILRCIF